MDSNNNFGAKIASVFMDMEAMIGANYDKGLAALKDVSEAAEKERAAEAEAEAEAEAAAAAENEGESGDWDSAPESPK